MGELLKNELKNDKASELKCPLCQRGQSEGQNEGQFTKLKNQHRPLKFYWLCQTCDLIFLDPQFLVSAEVEKDRYQAHQNSLQDKGYLEFLQPMLQMILAYFKPGERSLDSVNDEAQAIQGLDFGCGPTPVLLELLGHHGFQMRGYDPFFAPDLKILTSQFDFIVSTEVFEHFFNPAAELQRLQTMLKSKGALFIMTQLHRGPGHFSEWYYPKDLTHVCFYSVRSFEWIRDHFNYGKLNSDGKNLVHLGWA